MDQGITAGCEADLFGAASLMITDYLLDRTGFINDPVPETAKIRREAEGKLGVLIPGMGAVASCSSAW